MRQLRANAEVAPVSGDSIDLFSLWTMALMGIDLAINGEERSTDNPSIHRRNDTVRWKSAHDEP